MRKFSSFHIFFQLTNIAGDHITTPIVRFNLTKNQVNHTHAKTQVDNEAYIHPQQPIFYSIFVDEVSLPHKEIDIQRWDQIKFDPGQNQFT